MNMTMTNTVANNIKPSSHAVQMGDLRLAGEKTTGWARAALRKMAALEGSGCFCLTMVTEDEEDDPSESAPISSNCTIFIPTSRDTHK